MHLNLCEGKPLGLESEVYPLLNEDGELYLDFIPLVRKYYLSSDKYKEKIELAIKYEIEHQIDFLKNVLPNSNKIDINSHHHMHLIPFVFKQIINLHSKYQFSNIRLIREPFIYNYKFPTRILSIKNLNIIKAVLLNNLSKRYSPILDGLNISYPELFFGVIDTGFMNKEAMLNIFNYILNKNLKHKYIEILLHPGRASVNEISHWKSNNRLSTYHTSHFRDSEREGVISDIIVSKFNNYLK